MTRPPTLVVFLAFVLLYVAVGIWTDRRVPPTGDEPYYLLAADALVHGEGFALDARWAAIGTSGYDVPDHLADLPQQSSPSLRTPGHFPLHDLGLSILLALPLVLGGRGLAVACVGIAMAAAIAVAYHASCRVAGPRASFFATVLAGSSVPALTYSGQLFPDSVLPLAVAAGIAALVGSAPLLVGAFGIAALPFLHLRAWPIAVALLLLLGRRRTWRERAILASPLLVVVVGYALLDLWVYGIAVPHAGFLLFFTRGESSIAAYSATTPLGAIGLFVDRAFGLLPAAPIALLAFVGAGIALRRRAAFALIPIPYLLLASAVDWTGGYSPQSRYLAALVPITVLLLALALEARAARLAAVPLALWTAVMSAVYVAVPGIRYDSFGVPPFADRTLDRAVGGHVSGIFPLLGTDGATTLLAIGWAAGLAVALLFGAVTRTSPTRATMPVGAKR